MDVAIFRFTDAENFAGLEPAQQIPGALFPVSGETQTAGKTTFYYSVEPQEQKSIAQVAVLMHNEPFFRP